jgi:TatD DNase family protein
MVTFKQAHNIREMAAALSAANVMVETDAPFLAPVPYRGRRNEPAYAALVGKRLAEEWQVSSTEVAAATSSNFRSLFELESDWPDGSA